MVWYNLIMKKNKKKVIIFIWGLFFAVAYFVSGYSGISILSGLFYDEFLTNERIDMDTVEFILKGKTKHELTDKEFLQYLSDWQKTTESKEITIGPIQTEVSGRKYVLTEYRKKRHLTFNNVNGIQFPRASLMASFVLMILFSIHYWLNRRLNNIQIFFLWGLLFFVTPFYLFAFHYFNL